MASLKQMLVLCVTYFGCLEYEIKNNHFITSVDKHDTVSRDTDEPYWGFTLLPLLRMQKQIAPFRYLYTDVFLCGESMSKTGIQEFMYLFLNEHFLTELHTSVMTYVFITNE